MTDIHRFLTYSEITNNDVHKSVSIDIKGLTLRDVKEAIETDQATLSAMRSVT